MVKLLKIDELQDGTQRFQSQLLLGTDTADFIMRGDGIMRSYSFGKRGFDFYKYEKPYEVVSDKSDIRSQIIFETI